MNGVISSDLQLLWNVISAPAIIKATYDGEATTMKAGLNVSLYYLLVKQTNLLKQYIWLQKMITKQPKWTGSDKYWNTITKVYFGVSYTRSTRVDKLN